ncbi:hypothetical protein HHK36_025825 [Tetracentron sinense]|uniref:Uncharacterized protein n=1 Tax=Tetracentron sinense TaxID=13715 RepID=A0A834YI60_TETSI|nr:hypothetical protein HHK36_025825 [Tetracentron sinense]
MANSSSTVPTSGAPPAAPSNTFVLSSISHLVPIKLDLGNYHLWRSLFLPILRGHNLLGLVDGSLTCPPQFLRDANDQLITTVNPQYTEWIARDQNLLTWINFTLSESLLPYIVGLSSSKSVWDALEQRMDYAYQGWIPPQKLTAMIDSHSPPNTQTWYTDTGASHHITSDLANLSIHSDYQGDDKVQVGNGQGTMNSSEGEGKEMETHYMVSSNDTTTNTQKEKKKQRTRTNRYGLVSFREVPDYMKDNEYILGYYRANWPLKEAFFSLFRWHNETLNIWTHLLGFVLFLGLTVVNLMQVSQVADLFSNFTRSFPITVATNSSHNSRDIFSGLTTFMDLEKTLPLKTATTLPEMTVTRWPFFVFLGGSMFCLLSSSTCHLFCCHSHHLNLLMLRIDYVGIAVMIVTSFFPPIYYIFQCDPHWQFIYLASITAIGFFTVITLLSPSLSTAAFRPYRALLFSAMGFSGIIPAIHGIVVNWSEPRCLITLAYESAMAASYGIGTVFYVSRIPERWKPGWFDLAGHSHQIFHVFVIMGAIAHYGAALVFLEWRNTVGCERIM